MFSASKSNYTCTGVTLVITPTLIFVISIRRQDAEISSRLQALILLLQQEAELGRDLLQVHSTLLQVLLQLSLRVLKLLELPLTPDHLNASRLLQLLASLTQLELTLANALIHHVQLTPVQINLSSSLMHFALIQALQQLLTLLGEYVLQLILQMEFLGLAVHTPIQDLLQLGIELMNLVVEVVDCPLVLATQLLHELGAELFLEQLLRGLEATDVRIEGVNAARLLRPQLFEPLDFGAARMQIGLHLLDGVLVALVFRLVLLQLVQNIVELRVNLSHN